MNLAVMVAACFGKLVKFQNRFASYRTVQNDNIITYTLGRSLRIKQNEIVCIDSGHSTTTTLHIVLWTYIAAYNLVQIYDNLFDISVFNKIRQ